MGLENGGLNSEIYHKQSLFRKHIARGILMNLEHELISRPGETLKVDVYEAALQSLVEKLIHILPDCEGEIIMMSKNICSLSFSDKESFSAQASEVFSDFILSHFSYEEIEDLSRSGRKMLNRLVEYEISENEVRLHIPLTILDNGMELRKLFAEALVELAKKITTNEPDFQQFELVTAESWIIYRLPDKILEKFGFTNIERNNSTETGSAIMSRDTLLKLYGSKHE